MEIRKLTVKITSNDGAVQTIDRTIRIENLESRSCLMSLLIML